MSSYAYVSVCTFYGFQMMDGIPSQVTLAW
jgi:hypothetical protein